jgi:hypothetical protein
MNNEIPYRYLNLLNEPLIDEWKLKVPDFKKVFLYSDHGCELLKPNLKNLFLECGLTPFIGNLWSWEPNTLPKFYHTDQKIKPGIKKLTCALNWLIQGEPGITEWSYRALDEEIDMGIKGNSYGTDSQWWGSKKSLPEFSAVLNKPMLIKVDVPHRVNTIGVNDYRISYSLRFAHKPDWSEVLLKLKDYIEQR